VGGETVPKTFNIPALGAGDGYTVQRKVLLGIAQNYQNTVTVDVNNEVFESREGNNQAEEFYSVAPAPDTSGLTNFTYNEMLATILRGVLIDQADAQSLNVAPGYYRIREFRVSTQTNEAVKALSIEKNYAELISGQSVLPKRDEPWVFSIIQKNELNLNRRAFVAQDFYGHTFKYEMELDTVLNCWKIVSAVLDCAKVGLSTQNSITEVLTTCDWSSEPSWATP
jgi:hypothetical protein